MRVEINGFFRAHAHSGSRQHLQHLTAALRRGFPDIQLVEREPPRWLRGRTSKVAWEQIGWPLASARGGPAVPHVPYLAPPVLGPRCVVTAHDVIQHVLPAYGAALDQRLYGLLARLGIRRSSAVIAVSDWTRRDLIRVLGVPSDRIRVIPNGVDERFRPGDGGAGAAIRARYGLPEAFAFYLGWLDARKNLGVLLRAWPRVWSECRVALVIAGRAPRPQSRAFVDWFRGLDRVSAPWLRVLGPVPEQDKPDLYRAALVFVFPSRYEGFGLGPLEAMACGVPVVAADATSLPEVVGEAGVLVPPDDADAWSEAVTTVLQDPRRAERLKAAGVERAREFTWDRAARATYQVYREVAS